MSEATMAEADTAASESVVMTECEDPNDTAPMEEGDNTTDSVAMGEGDEKKEENSKASKKSIKKAKGKEYHNQKHKVDMEEMNAMIKESKLVCGSCILPFDTVESLREHRKGEEHQYHVKRKTAMLVPGQVFCKVCNQVMPPYWENHMESLRHKASLEALIALEENEEGVDYSKPFRCSEDGVIGDQILTAENEYIEETKDIRKSWTITMPQFNPCIGLKHITKSGYKYSCKICNMLFTFKMRSWHINGEKHRMNYLKDNYPAYYEECQDVKINMRRKVLLLFYASKVAEREKGRETEDELKLKALFFDPELAEAETKRIDKEKERRLNQNNLGPDGQMAKRPRMDGPNRGAWRGSRGGPPRGRGGFGGNWQGYQGGPNWPRNTGPYGGHYGGWDGYGPHPYHGGPPRGPPRGPYRGGPPRGRFPGGGSPHMTPEEMHAVQVLERFNSRVQGGGGDGYQGGYGGPRSAWSARPPPRGRAGPPSTSQLPRGTGGWW